VSRWRGIIFVGWWGERFGWTCRRCSARSAWPGVEGGYDAALAEAVTHCEQGEAEARIRQEQRLRLAKGAR
jgi:hypothetical protein